MMDQSPTRPRLGPSHEAEHNEYHALSGLAVAALVAGLLSVVGLVDPRASLVAAVGIVLSCLALWRIARRSPELVGRKAALIGLMLSLLFGSISLGHCLVYRWLLAHQARQVGMTYFDFLASEQPEMAHQLLFGLSDRVPPGENVWDLYRSNQQAHQSLEKYLDRPIVRTLLALGKKATVRPYATEAIDTQGGEELVVQLYSITFDLDGQRTTFLARLVLRRPLGGDASRNAWRITSFEGGVRPIGEEDDPYLLEKLE